MLNPIAEKLIHNLRYDEHTRKHYSITSWDGRGTCGSVGCISGTAFAMYHKLKKGVNFYLQAESEDTNVVHRKTDGITPDFLLEGCRILDIPESVGRQLFFPFDQWIFPLLRRPGIPRINSFLVKLGHNQRPSECVVEEWEKFAEDTYDRIVSVGNGGQVARALFTPDASANALEQVTLHEMPYVDWLRACREAGTV